MHWSLDSQFHSFIVWNFLQGSLCSAKINFPKCQRPHLIHGFKENQYRLLVVAILVNKLVIIDAIILLSLSGCLGLFLPGKQVSFILSLLFAFKLYFLLLLPQVSLTTLFIYVSHRHHSQIRLLIDLSLGSLNGALWYHNNQSLGKATQVSSIQWWVSVLFLKFRCLYQVGLSFNH